MGTRRSRHNRGRKPFYKDHERTTLADIAPPEAGTWQEEADAFLADRHLNQFKETRGAFRRPDFFKVQPNPELEDIVKRYRDKKLDENARAEANNVFPSLHGVPEYIAFNGGVYDDVARASHHDVLMELFSERRIGPGKLHAGRRWQSDREMAMIQPSRSIDWSGMVRGYQSRGTISEGQWGAMKRRRQFIEFAGIACATFLDFCLEPDRGRDMLVRALGIPAVQIDCAVEDMLSKLCQCFSAGYAA